MRAVHIITRKTRDGARLAWPAGTPAAYRRLADACMSALPDDRPPFAAVEAALTVNLASSVSDSTTHMRCMRLYGDAAGGQAAVCCWPGGLTGGCRLPSEFLDDTCVFFGRII